MKLDACQFNCLLAAALFGSMVYIMLNQNKGQIMADFVATLNEEQNVVYQQIIKERMTIYIQGLLLGLLLGFVFLAVVERTNTAGCLFAVIVLGVNHLYYALAPKSQYMVPLLTTNEQRVAWMNVYTEMKYRCAMGFVLGTVSYLLVGLFVKN